MAVSSRSPIYNHHNTLERRQQDWHRVSKAQDSIFMDFCHDLESSFTEIAAAMEEIEQTRHVTDLIQGKVRELHTDILAHRARGQMRALMDARESRDFADFTTIRRSVLQRVMQMKNGNGSLDRLDEYMEKCEDILRRHYKLIRRVYRHYAAMRPPSRYGLSFDALIVIYQDCKLRSKGLPPSSVEVIYNEICEAAATERGDISPRDSSGSEQIPLAPDMFIEALLRMSQIRQSTKKALPDKLEEVLTDHIKVYALQDIEEAFRIQASTPNVREVLRKHDDILRSIFFVYASLDQSTESAQSKVTTMNINEFSQLLTDCEILDSTFGQAAVKATFENIQRTQRSVSLAARARDDDGNLVPSAVTAAVPPETQPSGAAVGAGPDMKAEDGLDDDSELAFSEFVDGMVAVALFKNPNPFISVDSRLERLLVDKVFTSLRTHWNKPAGTQLAKTNPSVLRMLRLLSDTKRRKG
uniref:Uncharacterized protein n=1 Tax=Vitrella brassicaformis TaxID=1169539 RepID=A0A7S1JTC3_9ALVE